SLTRVPPGELFGAKRPGDVERGASVQLLRDGRIFHIFPQQDAQKVIEFEGCYSARQGRERSIDPANAASIHRGEQVRRRGIPPEMPVSKIQVALKVPQSRK